MAALIEIERLTKRFGAFTAVDDVSFTVDRGDLTLPALPCKPLFLP